MSLKMLLKMIGLKRLFKIALIHFLVIVAVVVVVAKTTHPTPTDVEIICYFFIIGAADLCLSFGWFIGRVMIRTIRTAGKVLFK